MEAGTSFGELLGEPSGRVRGMGNQGIARRKIVPAGMLGNQDKGIPDFTATGSVVGGGVVKNSITKAKKASIPKSMDPSKVTVAEALKYLSLPRILGIDLATGKDITASIGRFGPYVVRDGDFRSIKLPENAYDITLEKALELLAQEKKQRGFARKKKAV
jgi:DNA topoisomerase-1